MNLVKYILNTYERSITKHGKTRKACMINQLNAVWEIKPKT